MRVRELEGVGGEGAACEDSSSTMRLPGGNELACPCPLLEEIRLSHPSVEREKGLEGFNGCEVALQTRCSSPVMSQYSVRIPKCVKV